MSVGSFMIHAPISQPAPQPSPCEPNPTADAAKHKQSVRICPKLTSNRRLLVCLPVVLSSGGNQSAERRVKMFPMAGPAAAFRDCPTTIQWYLLRGRHFTIVELRVCITHICPRRRYVDGPTASSRAPTAIRISRLLAIVTARCYHTMPVSKRSRQRRERWIAKGSLRRRTSR